MSFFAQIHLENCKFSILSLQTCNPIQNQSLHQIQLICNSYYNIEVATEKAYNLLYVATGLKSDKRFIFTLGFSIGAILGIAYKTVGIISAAVTGNLLKFKNCGSIIATYFPPIIRLPYFSKYVHVR